MSEDNRYARNVQALARQSVIHHRRREEELERILADALALPSKGCKCRTCKHLRALARELAEEAR
jgi:hypothetical protein